MLDIALLGTGGMMPLPTRFLASMICRFNGGLTIIDCGEGTQVSLKILGWGYKNIDIICITHFHGDHVSGLPGLLLAIANSGRTEPISLIGPKGLKHIVESLCVIARDLPFKLVFNEVLEPSTFTFGDMTINTEFGNHRTICLAYSLEISRLGKFNLEKATELNLPRNYWSVLQKGNNVEHDGKIYTPDMVMGEARKGIKLSYCTDTRPSKKLEEFAENSDLLICEGIYGDDEKINKAKEYKHMLFSEAATIAKNSNSKELWLTHYSPSLIKPEEFLPVAQKIFENAKCGYDRKTKTINFTED